MKINPLEGCVGTRIQPERDNRHFINLMSLPNSEASSGYNQVLEIKKCQNSGKLHRRLIRQIESGLF